MGYGIDQLGEVNSKIAFMEGRRFLININTLTVCFMAFKASLKFPFFLGAKLGYR